MPKYYVESDNFRLVVQAEDARTAAVWAVHVALEKPEKFDEVALSADQAEDLQSCDGTLRLGTFLSVSEIGFGRCECGIFDTFDVMVEWNQLAVAVSRLGSLMDRDE